MNEWRLPAGLFPTQILVFLTGYSDRHLMSSYRWVISLCWLMWENMACDSHVSSRHDYFIKLMAILCHSYCSNCIVLALMCLWWHSTVFLQRLCLRIEHQLQDANHTLRKVSILMLEMDLYPTWEIRRLHLEETASLHSLPFFPCVRARCSDPSIFAQGSLSLQPSVAGIVSSVHRPFHVRQLFCVFEHLLSSFWLFLLAVTGSLLSGKIKH